MYKMFHHSFIQLHYIHLKLYIIIYLTSSLVVDSQVIFKHFLLKNMLYVSFGMIAICMHYFAHVQVNL